MKQNVKNNTSKKDKKTKATSNKVKTTSQKTSKHKIYIDYNVRLISNIILFLMFFSVCLVFATKTLEKEKLDPINYSTKGDINYRVYLNNNNYYSEDYLEMNKAYVASLIKNINVDFNYLFSIDKKTNMDFDYKIVGELVIENNNGLKRYFEKEYNILDTKKKKIRDGRVLDFNESIKIDYAFFNSLANNFKAEYGLETNSYLNVYMLVNSKTDEALNYKIAEHNKIGLKIPLSERAIEINIDSSNQNTNKQVIPTGSVMFNVLFLTAEIGFFIITCVFLSKTISYVSLLSKKQNAYDKYVNKLLKDYDRLIVETNNQIDLNDYNVTHVRSFTELLDVRDNLKMPIMYFNVAKHEKGLFYIKNNKDVYLVTIKNVDLEKK